MGAKRSRGRPPFNWTEELEAEIFFRLSEGESLKKICETDGMPSRPTFNERVINDPDFSYRYARARELQADHFFDECVDIADLATTEEVATARLRIDTRKWASGKLRPKTYGDKIDHTSSDGSMTPKAGLDVSKLSNEALAEIVALQDDNNE